MGTQPKSLDVEGATALAEFLKETGGEYVAVVEKKPGGVSYVRACEYPGFITIPGGDAHNRGKKFYTSTSLAATAFQHAEEISVVHRTETPNDVWGVPEAAD